MSLEYDVSGDKIAKTGPPKFAGCCATGVFANSSLKIISLNNLIHPNPMDPPPKPTTSLFDVYLRLRPSFAPSAERYLDVEASEHNAPTHITIRPPVNDHRKRAIEKFAFTRVFEEDASQLELFRNTGLPGIIGGVLGHNGSEGRDGLLATLGVTGSGKSHTILGTKAQRGLTQLSLDVLFQSIGGRIADLSRNVSTLQTLCAADVSEAQLLSAGAFLELMYGDGMASDRVSRATSRAATPMMVGAFPLSPPQAERAGTRTKNMEPLGLYPRFSHVSGPNPIIRDRLPFTSSSSSSHLPFAFSQRTLTKPSSSIKDTSFMSMTGPSSKKYIPRLSTLPQYPIVEDIEVQSDEIAEYAIVIGMYEVYNDRIFDLLAGPVGKAATQKRRGLLFKSTEQSTDRKVVAGLRKVICSSLDEAMLVLETGLTERRVAGTGSNATSSRSHGFFCVEVKKRRKGAMLGPWTSSNLTIVDLAGSERARTAKTAGATLAEAGKINESLMYLGQCMQMQSDNADLSKPQNIVPFRQCKLTELLFSNSFPTTAQQNQHHRKTPQKAIMIVTADPLGDFNATSQILRYSALAREVTVPRIPSVTSTILAGTAASKGLMSASGRMTPNAAQEELERALCEIASLREQIDVSQIRLDEEIERRRGAEASWKAAEERLDEIEVEVREEVWTEMEDRLAEEQRRWRAARDQEHDYQDEHLDRKLEILTKGIEIHEDPGPTVDERVEELEDENERLRAKIADMQREAGLGSPSKKMRVLKTRKWEGSGFGLDGSP